MSCAAVEVGKINCFSLFVCANIEGNMNLGIQRIRFFNYWYFEVMDLHNEKSVKKRSVRARMAI